MAYRTLELEVVLSIAKMVALMVLLAALGGPACAQTGLWGPPENMGAPINTDHNELSGVICPFDRALFFSRTVVGQNDLYVSYREGDQWGRPVPLTELNSPLYNETNPTFTSDGTRIYFTSDRAGGRGGFDIWTSTFDGSIWSAPEPLGTEINTANDEWFAAMGPDGMYISARTEAGLNRGDIFFAAGAYPDFSPRVPIAAVNSAGREMSAYPTADGSALYITCNRPGGEGLDDAWVSYRNDSGWQAPVMVHCDVNSADYDQYPTVGGSQGLGMILSSFNRPDGYGGADLYIAEWHPLGDTNGDKNASVADVILLVNYIFSDGEPPSDPYNDDMDCNGQVNMIDAILLVGYILRGGPAPCVNCAP